MLSLTLAGCSQRSNSPDDTTREEVDGAAIRMARGRSPQRSKLIPPIEKVDEPREPRVKAPEAQIRL
jgi:hypothetical protein